jgi:chromosome segregation ATPase
VKLQNTSQTTEIPVVALPPDPVSPASQALDERVRELEARLGEALSLLAGGRGRFDAMEGQTRDLSRKLSDRQTALEARLAKIETAPREEAAPAAKVQALEDRLDIEAKRQRGAEDDVAMALRNLAERGEKLHQLLDGFATQTQEFAMTIAALATRVGALEGALQEKTSQTGREADDIRSQIEALQGAIDERLTQGRREAEDIRAQIAPLLEAESRRNANAEAGPAEVDRLRESLADSLADLSERLRRAVRGL